MEEKSNLEIVKDFAKSTNRIVVAEELPYPLTGIRTFQKYKRMIFIPNNKEKTSFFIWFSDPYAKIGLPTIFSGAFIPLPSNIKAKINIRSMNVLDKVNVISKAKSNKIGSDYFDSKVIITGEIDSTVKRFLTQPRIYDQLLKALKINSAINISINEYPLDFVPELSNTSYLAIINPQSWDLESVDIEKIFRQIEKVRDAID